MPIRIEHQPSPYAVGLAAWQTGVGARRQRQQKYALDLFQQDQAIRARREEQFQSRQFAQVLTDQRQAAMDERQKAGLAAMDVREQRRLLQGRSYGLPQVPQDISPADASELGKMRLGLGKMSAMIDPSDPAQLDAYEQAELDYMDAIRSVPKLSAYDKAMQGASWLDKDMNVVPKGTPGAKPFIPDSSGTLVPAIKDEQAEQAATKQAAEAQKQVAAERQRKQDEQKALKDWRTAEQNRLRDFQKMKVATDDRGKLLYSSDDEIRMELDRVYGPQTPPPTVTPAQPAATPTPAVPRVDLDAAGNRVGAVQPQAAVVPVQPTAAPAAAPAPLRLSVDPAGNAAGIVQPQASGAPGGGAVRDVDQQIDLITSQGAPIEPATTSELQQQRWNEMLPMFQVQARRQYVKGSPNSRQALTERYGTEPFKFWSEQDDQPVQAETPRSAMREHVDAIRGRRGTGEGVRSDAARMLGSVEGAGGLAGREAAMERGAKGTRVTKYGPIIAEANADRQAAMNERYQRALAMQEQRERRAAEQTTGGLYLGAGAGEPANPDYGLAFGPAGLERFAAAGEKRQAREKELQRRKENLQARTVIVRNDADYAKLRPGTMFIGPDGKRWRKPA